MTIVQLINQAKINQMTSAGSSYVSCMTDSIGNTCAQNCCSEAIVSWAVVPSLLCSPQYFCANPLAYAKTSTSQICSQDSFGDKCAQHCCLNTVFYGGSQLTCTSQSVCQGTSSSYSTLSSVCQATSSSNISPSVSSSNSDLTPAIIGVSVSLSVAIVILIILLIIQCRKNCYLTDAMGKQSERILYPNTETEIKH